MWKLNLGYGITKECDENLPIINKTKHRTTKGKKKVQDGRTQVLANKETSKEGKSQGNGNKSSTQTPPAPPHQVARSI
jgi:hypothetical protein